MSDLPAPAPPVDVETAAFWAATAEHRLLLPKCTACGLVFWYPRGFCPDCGASPVEWIEASGQGTIHSFSIQRRLTGAYSKLASNVLAYVELAEGPRVMTNIVAEDDSTLAIGQPVELFFDDTGEGSALYRFRPASTPV
jgi:uncharacterized OB-fold protein